MSGRTVIDHLDHLPLFPLTGVLLFPGERLPLHIFEPRYRRMIQDVQKGGLPLAMGHIRSDVPPREDDLGRPEVFPIAGAGFIEKLQELPDGRFLIELVGERRIRIVREEDSALPYRVVRAEPAQDREVRAPDSRGALEKLERLILAIHQVEPKAGAALSRAIIHKRGASDVSDALSAALQVEPLLRQGWLSELDPLKRLDALAETLEIYLIQARGSPSGTMS